MDSACGPSTAAVSQISPMDEPASDEQKAKLRSFGCTWDGELTADQAAAAIADCESQSPPTPPTWLRRHWKRLAAVALLILLVMVSGYWAAVFAVKVIDFETLGSVFAATCAVCGVLALYFLPAIAAFRSKHHNAEAIACLNLLLGWTFVGWVIALVWALMKPADPKR
jgi:hypothetical protein